MLKYKIYIENIEILLLYVGNVLLMKAPSKFEITEEIYPFILLLCNLIPYLEVRVVANKLLIIRATMVMIHCVIACRL